MIRFVFLVVISLALPLAVGAYLDHILITRSPVATLLGAGVGVIVTTVIIVRKFSQRIGALAPRRDQDRLEDSSEREWEGG